MSTTHTAQLTPNFVLAQDTAQVVADLAEDENPDLTAPHAPLRPQRPMHYKWESRSEPGIVCTDVVSVERAVLRAAVTILRRVIGEHPVWAIETADVYDGYKELKLPLEATAYLLKAFAAHRGKVAPHRDTTETSAALDAAPLLDLPFDSVERVLVALSGVLNGYIDGTDDTLGNYQRAASVAHTITDLTEAMASYERDVLIPRAQAGEGYSPAAWAKEQQTAQDTTGVLHETDAPAG